MPGVIGSHGPQDGELDAGARHGRYRLVALQEPPVDDRDTQEALGVSWRPVEETFADMIAWLHASGTIKAKHAGALAGQVPPVI